MVASIFIVLAELQNHTYLLMIRTMNVSRHPRAEMAQRMLDKMLSTSRDVSDKVDSELSTSNRTAKFVVWLHLQTVLSLFEEGSTRQPLSDHARLSGSQ